jgi:hypothetical protein
MHRKVVERYNETGVPALALGKRPRMRYAHTKSAYLS